MKLSKKLINIILIFVILQLVGVVFINNTSYADSVLDEIGQKHSDWSQMGESGSQGILENATGVIDYASSVANVIRIACIVVFLVRVVLTAVKLSSDNSPDHKAIAKKEAVFLAILAALFIFAGTITTWLVGFFTDIQNQ